VGSSPREASKSTSFILGSFLLVPRSAQICECGA
jgi:hypothetical protein